MHVCRPHRIRNSPSQVSSPKDLTISDTCKGKMNSLSTKDEPRIGITEVRTSVESTPKVDVDAHVRRPLMAPPQLWPQARPISLCIRIANAPFFPDTPLSQSGDCLRTPPSRIQGVLVSPPGPRCQLSMRPVIGRSVFERAGWTLEVRTTSSSRPSHRPIGESLFLPIQDSPSPHPISFRVSFREAEGPVTHQVSQQRTLSMRRTKRAIAIKNDQVQQTKFQIYPAPPENVYFPKF
jgi:hypothetical protein